MPLTPKTSLSTLASLMPMLSSSFSTMLRSRVMECIRLRRERVSVRSWRCHGGGTKLLLIRPWRSSLASHSASQASVLRPGTFLTR